MDEVLPLFKSHYSLGRSILTLENSETAPDEADSVFDICKENEMNEVVVVDHNMSGFLQAYQNSKDLNIKLIFGVRLTICNDMSQKDADSLKTNNKIIILLCLGLVDYFFFYHLIEGEVVVLNEICQLRKIKFGNTDIAVEGVLKKI